MTIQILCYTVTLFFANKNIILELELLEHIRVIDFLQTKHFVIYYS